VCTNKEHFNTMHRIYVAFFVVLGGVGAAQADLVFLENGDRLSGEILGVDDGLLQLQTPYGEALSIPLTAVSGVELDDPQVARDLDGMDFEDVRALGTADTSGMAPSLDRLVALGPSAEALDQKGAMEEAPEEEAPAKPRRWSGKIDAGLTMRRGNTDTLDSVLGGTLKRDNEWNVLTLKASAAYAEADDVLNTRRYQGSVRWQVYPRDRFYVFLAGGAEHDTGRKLDIRSNVAAGVGYDVIEKERVSLSLDGGLDFTYEEWAPFTPAERRRVRSSRRQEATTALGSLVGSLADGSTPFSVGRLRDVLGLAQDIRDPIRFDRTRTEEFLTFRSSARYEQQLFRNSTLSEELTVFSNLEDFGEFRLVSELAFSTPISDSLDLRIALKTEYDSNARRVGVNAWDNTLISGLSYKF